MTILEFSRWSRLGRTRVYEEIGAGALRAIKAGRRTLITLEDAQTWLEALPAVGSKETTNG
jgi:hypothetical protein